MKTLFAKITLFFLLLCLSAGFTLFAQAQTNDSPKKVNDPDTTKQVQGEFPFEAEEISISEDKIYIRTKDGKKIILGGEESAQEIIVDEGRIRIGDVEIDLKGLEGLEASEALEALLGLEAIGEISRVRTPKAKISPRVYTTSEDIVKFGRDVVVEEDEEIDGDVVALWGNVEVKGVVDGSAVAIYGDVEVFPTGIVEEDAVSIGGQVIKRGEAVVRGEKVSVGFLRTRPSRLPHMITRFPTFTPFGFPAWAFVVRIFKILFFIFLGIVVLAILPRHVHKVKEKVKHDLLKSGLVGLVAQILVIPIFILLIITIIGIPVALLIEPLVIIAALILGYTSTCLFVGEKLQEHTSLKPETKIMMLVMGILAVELVPLVARTIGVFGGPFSPFMWIFSIVGWLIAYVVITVGFGAAILSRLGTRPKDTSPATAAVNATKTDSNEKPSG